MIVDFHTHVFPDAFRKDRDGFFKGEPAFESIYNSSKAPLIGFEKLISKMDERGIDKSVIFGFPWEKKENYQRHNDYIMEAVRSYPERLIGFCCFAPSAPGAARETERCLQAGLSGAGELAVYGSGLSERVRDSLSDVMSLLTAFNAPLLLHTNEPVGHSYPGKAPMTLGQIYAFLKAYPSNTIVLAHWGGGLFFYASMKKEVQEVLDRVWFDTAASPFLYKPQIYAIAGEIIGFDRILFGSDYPLIDPERYFEEMNSSGIAPDSVDRVRGLNASDLLGL